MAKNLQQTAIFYILISYKDIGSIRKNEHPHPIPAEECAKCTKSSFQDKICR